MKTAVWFATCGLLLSCATSRGKDMSLETPKYERVSQQGALEIRNYAAHVVAVVEVEGPRKEGLYRGFRTLADYIFGKNQSRTQVAMTAPVSQQQAGNVWRVTFMMPSKYTLETLPTPENASVKFEIVGPRKMAALAFSGWATDGNVEKHRLELLKEVQAKGLQTVGEPVFAQFDPPWRLPFFRKNEWLWELR